MTAAQRRRLEAAAARDAPLCRDIRAALERIDELERVLGEKTADATRTTRAKGEERPEDYWDDYY